MRGFVAVTDYEWHEFLRTQRDLDEVNFWQPSGGGAFRAIQPGEPLLFKLHAPLDAIAGYGVFARHEVTHAWLAWEAFGPKNGAPDFASMTERIATYLRGPPAPEHKVGCIMLAQPVFFPPGSWVRPPVDWKRNIVRGKGYDLGSGEGKRIWEDCLERTPPPMLEERGPRYGPPQLVQPRLGQGTFRLAVTQAYRGACAVTTEHSLPVLEAAHIRPYGEGGEHRISNGVLLRTDVHRLFDRGYVTITPEQRFEVSRRLENEWHNGRAYYALHGRRVQVPESAAERPDPVQLTWHNENRFRH
ncbi:MAG: HNH endonuclease [Planctomycetota bacterium]